MTSNVFSHKRWNEITAHFVHTHMTEPPPLQNRFSDSRFIYVLVAAETGFEHIITAHALSTKAHSYRTTWPASAFNPIDCDNGRTQRETKRQRLAWTRAWFQYLISNQWFDVERIGKYRTNLGKGQRFQQNIQRLVTDYSHCELLNRTSLLLRTDLPQRWNSGQSQWLSRTLAIYRMNRELQEFPIRRCYHQTNNG